MFKYDFSQFVCLFKLESESKEKMYYRLISREKGYTCAWCSGQFSLPRLYKISLQKVLSGTKMIVFLNRKTNQIA